MIITIPKPCSANWNEMKPVDGCSRHCASCNKEVVDFTVLNDHHLHHYLNQHPGVCGRFAAHQLNRDILPYYAPPKSKWTFRGWAIAVGVMFAVPPLVSAQMPTKIGLHSDGKRSNTGKLIVKVLREGSYWLPVTIKLMHNSNIAYDSISQQQQNGHFQIENISVGEYNLVVSASGHETSSQLITITDSITYVTINLKQRVKPLFPELDGRSFYQGFYVVHDVFNEKKEPQIKKTPWAENMLKRLKAK